MIFSSKVSQREGCPHLHMDNGAFTVGSSVGLPRAMATDSLYMAISQLPLVAPSLNFRKGFLSLYKTLSKQKFKILAQMNFIVFSCCFRSATPIPAI